MLFSISLRRSPFVASVSRKSETPATIQKTPNSIRINLTIPPPCIYVLFVINFLKMMKKICFLIIALSLAFTLSGCISIPIPNKFHLSSLLGLLL